MPKNKAINVKRIPAKAMEWEKNSFKNPPPPKKKIIFLMVLPLDTFDRLWSGLMQD